VATLRETKDQLVQSATAVTMLMLLGLSGALALGSAIFIGFDLIASYMSWGQEMAYQVNLPYQDVLSVVLTAMPSLVQLAFVAARIAGLPFAENNSFKTLYLGSAAVDTILDTVQMFNGTFVSFAFSVFMALVVFLVLSEFLFIFSTSVFVSLLHRLKNETDLWNMAMEQVRGSPAGGKPGGKPGGQTRGRQ